MKKKFSIILLLGVIYFTGSTLIDAGTFKKVENKINGDVINVYESLYGPEDLDIDYENGLLFISSSDRWTIREGGEPTNDGIFVMDLDSADRPVKLQTDYKAGFHPHGISFLQEGEKKFLYVVNHNENGSSVEIFEYSDNQLLHQETIQDEMLCCANDLVAVGDGKFYITNDHGYKKGFMRMLEDYLRLPKSYLLYYDGNEFSMAYEDLNYANGVAVSNDGRELYLTHTTGREMLTFDRNPETEFLEVKSTLKLGTGVDNITVDEKGNIWIAAHPKLFSFVEHSKDRQKLSPSEVIKITPFESNTFGVERVYTNDGSELSGSSVALAYKDEILVGVVFQNKLLRARINSN